MSIVGAIIVTLMAVGFGVAGLLMSWRFVNKLSSYEPPAVPPRETPPQ